MYRAGAQLSRPLFRFADPAERDDGQQGLQRNVIAVGLCNLVDNGLLRDLTFGL